MNWPAKERWDALWRSAGAAQPPPGWYDTLSAAYAEPHRHYHTQQHIAECLAEFDRARHLAIDPIAVELAMWFHDAVYDPRASDNEEQSAALASRCLAEAGIDSKLTEVVSRLIMATKHHFQPTDSDTALIVDVDLSILGQTGQRFAEYEEQIRREYAWVPRLIFKSKRAEILRPFLAREHIFATEHFRGKYEARARLNLESTIGKPRVSIRRIAIAVLSVVVVALLAYALWRPGLDITDGRHDRGSNGIWLAHGWLGADQWFVTHGKTNEFAKYRSPANIQALAGKLKRHRITDVFPHLCPAAPTGQLPSVDANQVEQFLNVFEGFRVMPWIGGPNGTSVELNDRQWRSNFITSARTLLAQHPRLSGIHLNVEPLTDGDKNFLVLLEELRAQIPAGKLLSVAAYPPPTWWHPFPDVHWSELYFREVARRSDHLAVMMYDAGQKIPRTYQRLMADWTAEVLDWSEGKPVLLGVPTYDDAGVDYHDPKVENLTNALLGIHRGLSRISAPSNYQGVTIYCDWETTDAEWQYLRDHFLKSP